jgi:hypothetical protein
MIQSLIRNIYDTGLCHENSTLKSDEVQDKAFPPKKNLSRRESTRLEAQDLKAQSVSLKQVKPELSKLIGINNLKGLAILESYPSRSVRVAIVRSWW